MQEEATGFLTGLFVPEEKAHGEKKQAGSDEQSWHLRSEVQRLRSEVQRLHRQDLGFPLPNAHVGNGEDRAALAAVHGWRLLRGLGSLSLSMVGTVPWAPSSCALADQLTISKDTGRFSQGSALLHLVEPLEGPAL